MVTSVVQSDFRPTGGNVVRTARDQFSAAGSMDWTRFEDTNVIAQVGGSASALVAVVERSPVDPGPTGALAVAAPADSVGFSGNPSTGIPGNVYIESGVGWWRIRVISCTGVVQTFLSGKGG